MSSVLSITDSEFESQVLNTAQPVLVYFWAPWCGPCRLMSPTMDWALQTYGDRLKVVKMEIDPNPETVAKYQVQGVPALLLFKDGEKLEEIEGAISKQKVENFLNSHLSPAV
ncbi:thioredoxin [Oculatella sp. LEGE 06141]|uniref:thioredoxin n=1 Tax=Oculatella sp. LEGE 06141 TaxID=1828648 RepID=UPI001881F3A1|nr:thioredoxin [Oculatella sp. LEGE 06141]MBE9177654.1 thioredoxin [Oculatella sp. LEGE 06141]